MKLIKLTLSYEDVIKNIAVIESLKHTTRKRQMLEDLVQKILIKIV